MRNPMPFMIDVAVLVRDVRSDEDHMRRDEWAWCLVFGGGVFSFLF